MCYGIYYIFVFVFILLGNYVFFGYRKYLNFGIFLVNVNFLMG